MEIINLSKNKFSKLSPLELHDSILNTECKLYLLEDKKKWANQIKLLKKFYITDGIIFGNKLQTINSLINQKDIIDIPELIIPEKLAAVSDQIVGYTMPYIDSINLSEALSSKISSEQKLTYLYQIGTILKKMKLVREYTNLKDFYLNDLHENNFIVDSSNNEVKVVDLDSCKINGNYTFSSKYLTNNSLIKNIYKYPKITEENSLHCGGVFVPNENTDNYCYIIMILNFLYGSDITKIPISEFYNYLEYLKSINISNKLIEIFSNILTNQNNENPVDYLECLVPYIGRCHQNVYNHVKKKSL